MTAHVRNVRVFAIVLGVPLGIWAAWRLAMEGHSRSVVESWLIVLAFAVLLVTAGAAFGRTRWFGRALMVAASLLIVLFAAVWLLFGGVEDAGSYWPIVVLGLAFATYASFVSLRVGAA